MVKLSSKGQMEVIGLVVIVILIALGMLLMATFALKSEPQKKIFTRKGLAYSTMSAVMKTSISPDAACYSSSQGAPKIGSDLFEDCVKYRGASASIYQCLGPVFKEPLHSCDFLGEMVSYLLNQTLGSWNKNYEFHARLIPFQGEKAIELIEPVMVGGCPAWKERDSSGLFPINTEAGLVENSLYLCD